jgi:hypothetical protein
MDILKLTSKRNPNRSNNLQNLEKFQVHISLTQIERLGLYQSGAEVKADRSAQILIVQRFEPLILV